MDSLAAGPGMGPGTGALPVVKRAAVRSYRDLPTDRTLVMGILNVTPDSFSDGGRHLDHDAAIRHGLALVEAGADLVDVGGESTRPGADPVDPEQEQRRILPVVQTLLRAGVVVSVDTRHLATAREVLKLGPVIVNDVSGLGHDPQIPELIARTGAAYVLMHNRGDAQTMDERAGYEDVVADVVSELTQVRDAFYAAGVKPEQIIVDPGLGFAKRGEQNWELLRGLDRLAQMGHPVLVGASRKRFLGTLLASTTPDGAEPAATERDAATAAVSALSALNGAWAVRVHDVPGTRDAVLTAAAWAGRAEQG